MTVTPSPLDMVGDIGARMTELLGDDRVSGLGVGVSGGGDSLALMLCLASWTGQNGVAFRAVTVDHRLRPEAAQEARKVAEIAAQHDIAHDVVAWTDGWDGQGNLQDHARSARFDLMAAWAQDHAISHVALGHTADDQAETLLMRLARGAGVDGLSAIPPRRMVGGIAFLRPMLDLSRASLRNWLTAQGQLWIEDPSNDDTAFDRIKARRALELLDTLGVDRSQLAMVAQNMAEARKALNWFAYLAARDIVKIEAGDVLFDRIGFRTLPDEIQRRLLAHALCWISGRRYPPRRRPLVQMLKAVSDGKGMTLHGCQMTCTPACIRVTREFKAVAALKCPIGRLWDGRWQFIGPAGASNVAVAALGKAGLAQCPDWRNTGLPRLTLMALPGLWRDDTLVAAPMAGRADGWRQVLARGEEDFFAALMTR